MQPLTRGIYTARLADGSPDMDASLTLRQICFRPGQGRSDHDRFDAACRHVLVTANAAVVACFRVQLFARPQSLSDSYAAQFYDLAPMNPQARPMLELGRFCLNPAHADPDILRLAWAALTRLVDDAQAGLLFGCSSFAGADAARHLPALGYLAHHHLGPGPIRPRRRAPESIDLRSLADPGQTPALPPLLKTYLSMGGWVSDHAVLDRDLNTTHVFTALDIAAIPPARARALRALAQTS
ncbi:MAG: GNAT family N-acetyltransferase [Candidatus Saccharibacteria bacterium]|nr:GNAT family N-acetyltransferase [Pseudorhodobacter sp.]